MNALENFENLVVKVTGKIEAVIGDREKTAAEISSLRKLLADRDKEAVKATQDMMTVLEATQMDALRFEQERIRIEAKLQAMNDRLIALVGDEKRCGG